MPYFRLFSEIAGHIQSLVTHGGYAVLFIFTLFEGIPLLGMAVPGHVAIFIAGFLARIGTLNLYWVIILATLGAILGDYLGFYLGRKYGMGFIDKLRPYFFITDEQLARARTLLAKHTGKAMIIGRFTPATRALMPFLVGTGDTPHTKFWIFNTIGGISWAVISILIGYLFGAGYHAAAGYLGKLVVVAIIAAIIIVWGYRFVNMRFHIFRRYELFALGLNLISLFALARMVQDAFSTRSFMVYFDVWVSSHIVDPIAQSVLVPHWLAMAAYWVTTIGGFTPLLVLGLIFGTVFLFKERWRSAAIMFASVCSASIIIGTMKGFFLRARPDYAVTVLLHLAPPIVNDPSFPSGHAAMAAAFFTAFAYLWARYIHSWIKRELLILFSVLGIIAVGMSRILLNVHWASDVIAGWALGVFLATASILAVRYVSTFFIKKVE